MVINLYTPLNYNLKRKTRKNKNKNHELKTKKPKYDLPTGRNRIEAGKQLKKLFVDAQLRSPSWETKGRGIKLTSSDL